MPQQNSANHQKVTDKKKQKAGAKIQDTQKPRNESNPEINGIGTSSAEPIDNKNSPEVAEALKETQI